MARRLEGKVAAITGGASGIGEACVRRLASDGARVAVIDIKASDAERVANTVKQQGGDAHAAALDVRDAAAIESVTAMVEDTLGPIDVLVTSAGIIQVPETPEEMSLRDWDNIVAVDQRGLYVSCLAAGRRMATRGRGAIVNIASVAGMRSMPLHAYAPAKAAVISITESLAAEWGRSGVRVNAVAPGYTLTPALKAAIDEGRRDPTALAENAAMGRLVDPSEIANAVSFLASDEASAITGVTLPVDAGWLVGISWNTYGGLRPKRG